LVHGHVLGTNPVILVANVDPVVPGLGWRGVQFDPLIHMVPVADEVLGAGTPSHLGTLQSLRLVVEQNVFLVDLHGVIHFVGITNPFVKGILANPPPVSLVEDPMTVLSNPANLEMVFILIFSRCGLFHPRLVHLLVEAVLGVIQRLGLVDGLVVNDFIRRVAGLGCHWLGRKSRDHQAEREEAAQYVLHFMHCESLLIG